MINNNLFINLIKSNQNFSNSNFYKLAQAINQLKSLKILQLGFDRY